MILRAAGDDSFNDLADMPLWEECIDLRILPPPAASLTRPVNTMLDQIVSILVLVEEAIIPFFPDAGKVTESSLSTKVFSEVDSGQQSSRKGFQKCHLLFGGGRGGIQACTRATER